MFIFPILVCLRRPCGFRGSCLTFRDFSSLTTHFWLLIVCAYDTYLRRMSSLIQSAVIGYEERGVKNFGPPSTYANAHNPLPDRLHPYCVAVCAVFLTAFYFCIRGKTSKITGCRLKSEA